MPALFTAYEVRNPSFNDLSLEKQIEYGICYWRCDVGDKAFFGQSAEAAVKAARIYFGRA